MLYCLKFSSPSKLGFCFGFSLTHIFRIWQNTDQFFSRMQGKKPLVQHLIESFPSKTSWAQYFLSAVLSYTSLLFLHKTQTSSSDYSIPGFLKTPNSFGFSPRARYPCLWATLSCLVTAMTPHLSVTDFLNLLFSYYCDKICNRSNLTEKYCVLRFQKC